MKDTGSGETQSPRRMRPETDRSAGPLISGGRRGRRLRWLFRRPAVSAEAGGRMVSLSAEEVGDRIEIQDLLVRYTEAIDTKDWNLLDQCFLPDADLDYTTSGGIAGAYPEVRAWLAKALAMFPKTIHAISNSTIKLSGDRATGRTLVNNPMVLPKGEGGAFVFTVFAYYIDDFVRTAEGWRIAKRFEQQVLVTGDVPEGLDSGI